MKNMRRVFIIAALCILSATSAFAQSKDALKRAFDNGRFVEAKSMAEKLYAKHPDNSEYNYWYAACCIETGEIPDSIDVVKMLDFAVKRKIIKAHKYLGDWYFDKQRYDLATQNYKALVGKTKNKALREEAQRKHNVCARLDRMVCNSEVVCFIDSFIVDKEELLSVYSIGADAGLISTRAQYFGDDNLVGHINETQRGMDIYFSAENDAQKPLLKLYHCSKEGDKWGKKMPLEGFDTKGNDDYPYMLADGVTLYFASDGQGSIGGYDIFVSRMNIEEGDFHSPDNVGMPFNSTANDYLMVVDEVSNLGWFATDRNQPDDKVCIYVFVPNTGKNRVNVNEMGYERALSIANLSSIADTQTDEELVSNARRQMTMLIYAQEAARNNGDFLFVIDEFSDYRSLDDFKNNEARELFKEWQAGVKAHENDIRTLNKYRDAYASASDEKRESMRETILNLESKIESDDRALELKEYAVRRLELGKK